ncbi:MAG: hypothetical protein ABL925_20090 [Methylococcales bacterium]
MKKVALNKSVLATLLVATVAFTGPASAHFAINQNQPLGNTSMAQPFGGANVTLPGTDVYKINCLAHASGVKGFSIRVKDNRTTPESSAIISVLVQKGNLAQGAADGIANTSYGPWATVLGGEGEYTITVSKSSSADETYALDGHCDANDGSESNMSLPGSTAVVIEIPLPIQNQ